jgi:hypothetical protein
MGENDNLYNKHLPFQFHVPKISCVKEEYLQLTEKIC